MFEYGVFLIAAYISAAIATVAGFGSSTLLIPVALYFFDPAIALFFVACFHLFNNLFKIRLFFKSIDYKLFLLFGIPSIVFAFLGAYIVTDLSIEVLMKFVAIFLILFSCISFFKKNITIQQSPVNALIGGGLSGFFAGLIGIGGAVRAMFLMAFNLPKEVYVATAALIAIVVDLTRIPTYWFRGAVDDSAYLVLLPILIAVAYIGVKTGKSFLGKINQELFRKIVFGALFLVGIRLFFA